MSALLSAWAAAHDAPYTEPPRAIFDHPHNVTVGQGRVIFAEACTPIGGNFCERGWVLPGGARTTNRAIAEMVAGRIDAAIRMGYLTVPAY